MRLDAAQIARIACSGSAHDALGKLPEREPYGLQASDWRALLMIELSHCQICRGRETTPLLVASDPLKRVSGTFRVVKCSSCGFAYLNPRVPTEQLLELAPEGYGPSLTQPAQRSAFHGGRLLSAATRWALARYLGYDHLAQSTPHVPVRVLGRLRRRRLSMKYPPFLGQGRLLDIGCWTGGFLSRMAEVGWRVAGIEIIPAAGALARTVSDDLFVGDVMEAPFPDSSFDVVTAFHILEHLPDPLGALQRIVRWLAPGGKAFVEVPNFNSIGRCLFGGCWHGLDLPYHLSHFTPETLTRLVETAGGEITRVCHLADPHSVIKSLAHAGGQGGAPRRVAQFLRLSAVKRLLALGLGAACRFGYGEAIRVTVVPRSQPRAA